MSAQGKTRSVPFLLIGIILGLAAEPLRAATPKDELLALVPENVGFCLVLADLREHGKALADSPFVKQFARSPLGTKILHSPQTEKLSAVDQVLRNYLDLSAEQLRDEILGDALVLAYRPGPPGKPDAEEGIFLIRARDARLLGLSIERLNALQKDTGTLSKVEPLQYAGRTYYRRVEEQRVNYYYLNGPILAVTPQEKMLREVLDRESRRGADSASPLAREFHRLGTDGALAALWINPRTFEPALEQKRSQATGSQAAALQTLLRYWKSLQGIAVSLALDQDVKVSLAIAVDADQLPAPAKRFFSAMSRGDLWNAIPKDAILAVGGQVDFVALLDLLNDFLDDEARKPVRKTLDQCLAAVLGPEAVQSALAALGPDWALYVAVPPRSAKGWIPRALVAVRLQRGSPERPADVWLVDALNCLAALVAFTQNGGHAGPMALRITAHDGSIVRFLESDKFPPGFRPAFASKDGYLILASSPEIIRDFHVRASRPAAGAEASNVPLLRLSIPNLRSYLQERRENIVAYLGAKNPAAAAGAKSAFDGFLTVAQFVNEFELTRRVDSGRMILTLRVQPAQALK
jgi:hypothetical protein